MTAARRPAGTLEQDILGCLAEADGPLSPRQVRERLGRELAYTTVMTTLSRLHGKGVLTRRMAGRGFVYELPLALDDIPASVQAHRMRQILDSGDDRAGILARFVTDLTAEDERVLLQLLSDADAATEPGGGNAAAEDAATEDAPTEDD